MYWHLLWQIPVATLVCAFAGRFIGGMVWSVIRKTLRPRDRLSCLGLAGTAYACCGAGRMLRVLGCADATLCGGRARVWRRGISMAAFALSVVAVVLVTTLAGCGVSARAQTDQPAGLVEVASQVVETGAARVWITIFRDEERQAWVYLAVASNEAISLRVVPDADAGR